MRKSVERRLRKLEGLFTARSTSTEKRKRRKEIAKMSRAELDSAINGEIEDFKNTPDGKVFVEMIGAMNYEELCIFLARPEVRNGDPIAGLIARYRCREILRQKY